MRNLNSVRRCRVAVVWIDWYSYHLARFAGLQAAFGSDGEVVGVELVGGQGVHEGLSFRAERASDLPIYTLEPGASWNKVNKLGLAIKLWRKLSELNPECVLVPGYYNLAGITCAAWARMHGRQSILMTETTAFDHKRVAWKERLKRLLLRHGYDAAICGGTAHERYLHALGFDASRIGGFYDVVGNDKLAASTKRLRQETPIAPHSLPAMYLLYVGRLAPEKNVVGLLRAWMDYWRRGGWLALVIAGDGPERIELERMVAAEKRRPPIFFLGHRTAEELLPCFAYAEALVLPSTREPWGLVVNEAMAAGLPVLVSDRCGCAEDLVISGVNGMTFDPHDQQALIECMLALDRQSPAARRRMSDAAMSQISPYSPLAFGSSVYRLTTLGRRRGSSAAVAQSAAAG